MRIQDVIKLDSHHDMQVFLYASEVNYANTALDNLYVKGIQEGDAQKVRELPPFFIPATAFLKVWIVTCYESQSFVGLSDGRSFTGERTGADVNDFCLISVRPLSRSTPKLYSDQSCFVYRASGSFSVRSR